MGSDVVKYYKITIKVPQMFCGPFFMVIFIGHALRLLLFMIGDLRHCKCHPKRYHKNSKLIFLTLTKDGNAKYGF